MRGPKGHRPGGGHGGHRGRPTHKSTPNIQRQTMHKTNMQPHRRQSMHGGRMNIGSSLLLITIVAVVVFIENLTANLPFLIAILVIIGVFVVILYKMKIKAEQERIKDKQMADILNTDLDKFSDLQNEEVSELEKKYT